MLTPEQLANRVNYLGSSDAAAVLGISRWSTPIAVWAEKTGQVVREDGSSKLHVRLGHKMESVVAELFEEETGKRVQKVNDTLYHSQYPFIGCNIDRRVIGENAILEIKTTAAWKKEEWAENQAPAEYLCQVYHQLAVTNMNKAYLCCLIGNQDIQIREIKRDPVAIAELIKKEVHFWKTFVVPKVMPGPAMAADAEVLSMLFPEAQDGKEVDLGDSGAKLAEMRASLWQDYISLEKQIKALEAQMKAMLGDAERGLCGTYQASWSNVSRKAYEVPASQYRKFQVKPIKGEPNGNN